MKRFTVLFHYCLFCLSCSVDAASSNEEIVKFCRENLGKQVGNGQCTALAKYALESAGAQSRQKNADFPSGGWGRLVLFLEVTERGPKETGSRREIKPGDIIQFRDAKMKGKKASGRGYYTMGFKQHTAVVSEVENRGKVVKIFHQNFSGRKFVVEGSLTLDDLQTGWMRFYRAVR
jgi:hypothetical protein